MISVMGGIISTSSYSQTRYGEYYSYCNHHCITNSQYSALINSLKTSQSYQSNHSSAWPLFRWPMQELIGNGNILVNYVDDDNSAGIVKDYEGLSHTYDGHRGTDITLYNFRQMDRGVGIYSTSAGVCTFSLFTEFDRNIAPNANNANTIVIRHSDGGTSVYFHMRTNSNIVRVGDQVEEGTLIGLIGSSGASTDAHLHFEAGQFINSVYTWRDPWNGSYNSLPSLWQSQQPYIGTSPLKIHDIGIYTSLTAGGNVFSIPASYLKEKIQPPFQFGRTEPYVGVWVQLQGQQGDAYTVEFRRPDNSLFATEDRTLNTKTRYGWHYYAWAFNQPSGSEGTWYARILINGKEVKRIDFEVTSGNTVYPPRFPIAGKSFRRKDSAQQDTLKLELSGQNFPVTYELLNAESNISLINNVVTIDPSFPQKVRSVFFQVIAGMEVSQFLTLRDTMWYHMVDTTKPLEQANSVISNTGKVPERYSLSQNYPNPFNPQTKIDFTVPKTGMIKLSIYDVLGREVEVLLNESLNSGSYSIKFDGKKFSSGVYFYRLDGEGYSEIRKMVLLK